MPRLRPLALALLAAVVLTGCASGGSSRPDEAATLVLDFTANAVHAGIFTALDRDYTGAEGVTLRVEVPPASSDGVKLLLAGRADFAVLDIHDLALARERGRDLVGVMALVQRPLASVIAAPGVRTPRELEGRRVGVTGLPSDDAVLASIVKGAGGQPRRVRSTTIGFDAVGAILSGKVAGATAFWNVEGIALAQRRPGVHVFKVDDYGAPAYPELVLTVTRTTLQDKPDLVRATVAALQRGYAETLADPDKAVETLIERNPGLQRGLVARQLDAVQQLFQADDGTIGTLDTAGLRKWAAWEQRFGITKHRPEVALAFDPGPARLGAKQAAQTSGQ